MKAIITVKVPEHQIGQEVSIYFKDTMMIKGVVQEQKTGHWIKYGIPRCGEQHYKCTSCGYYINFGQWGELYTKEFKYCPNCGARMSESKYYAELSKSFVQGLRQGLQNGFSESEGK